MARSAINSPARATARRVDQREGAGLEELVVPPFLGIEVEARGRHDAQQQEAVALRLGRHGGVGVIGERRDRVEAGAHVQPLSVGRRQREIDGDAAPVRRPAARIGDEVGVRQMIPQRPLRGRRPVGVEDVELEAERRGELRRPQQAFGRLAMQETIRPSVDRLSRQIIRRRVTQIDKHVERGRRDFHQRHRLIVSCLWTHPGGTIARAGAGFT
jgi:hypothetical protein